VAFPALVLIAGGCLSTRYQSAVPQPAMDAPSRAVLDRITAGRQQRSRRPPSVVPELQPIAARGATAVARGEWSLKTAAQRMAVKGVEELGRHVWVFAAECSDLARFAPPPPLLEADVLLLGVAAIPAAAARTAVLVVAAEPGTSAIRADQMGGGTGGSNPVATHYAHPVVALGPCGDPWPASGRAPW
jgi:hypothetical protein